jgi:hypothetical protein
MPRSGRSFTKLGPLFGIAWLASYLRTETGSAGIIPCSDLPQTSTRNSPIKAHQINLQRSLIGSEYRPIRGRGQPPFQLGLQDVIFGGEIFIPR